MSKPWGPIAVGSFAAAYYIFWSSSWQDGIDSPRGTTRVRPSAPQITVPTPPPPPVPAGKTAEQKAAEEAARQEAARKAAELLAAQQRAAEQKAAEQKAAVAAAAASAAAQAAYAAEEMARINELKKAQAAMKRAAADKRKAEAEATKIISRKEEFANAYALESTYPDWWPGTKAPNVINHHPLIVQMLNEANALGVLELHEDRKMGGLGPMFLRPPMQSEENLKAAKQTLTRFNEMKSKVWSEIYPADKQIFNLIINHLEYWVKRAEKIAADRIQNQKARAAYEAAVAAAAPNVQTNYLITLQNPIEVSILIGNLQNTAKMHIRESSKRYVLSTRPWGNNVIPKSSKNDGYIDGLDLLKLPINPKQVDKVNRKVLESGMDEYGGGFKLTFTDNKGKNLIEIDLGSPTSVTDFPVDRVNSEINDIGRNIRYSAKVVSYN